MIDNYFVTSSTQPHTWAYGKVNEVTGFASHARVNVPSDTTTIEEFGESLRRHPKVLRVEAQRNHQSDFTWKVWMVGNRVDIMGYSKFQDQKGPASGGGAGVSLNHAWVGFGAGHQRKNGCNDSSDSREMRINVLLDVMGYASPFP